MSEPENQENGRDEAIRLLKATNAKLVSDGVEKKIDEQAQETKEVMLKNEISHPADKSGLAPQVKLPWWPIADLPVVHTNRERVFREDQRSWKAWDHGIVHFLYGLAERKVIEKISPSAINAVLQGHVKAVLFEAECPTNLSNLKPLIENGGRKSGYIRDTYVIPLATLHLLQHHDLKGRGAKTGIGMEASYAAKAFIGVYADIVCETDIKYSPKSADGLSRADDDN